MLIEGQVLELVFWHESNTQQSRRHWTSLHMSASTRGAENTKQKITWMNYENRVQTKMSLRTLQRTDWFVKRVGVFRSIITTREKKIPSAAVLLTTRSPTNIAPPKTGKFADFCLFCFNLLRDGLLFSSSLGRYFLICLSFFFAVASKYFQLGSRWMQCYYFGRHTRIHTRLMCIIGTRSRPLKLLCYPNGWERK